MKKKSVVISVLICALLLFIAFKVNQAMDYPDFMAYWLAGKFIIHGESPYNEVLFTQEVLRIGWLASPVFLYPLATGLFFTPWAMLPYRFSYSLWMFFGLALILASSLLTLSTWKNKRGQVYLIPVIAGLIVFRPAIVAIRNGQLGPLLLFILIAGFLLWEKHIWFLGGLVLAFLLMKPSIGLPILALIVVSLLVKKKWKAVTGMAIGLISIMAAGWINDPLWVGKYLQIGQQKFYETFGLSPSIWGFAYQSCGQYVSCTFVVGGLLVIALLGLYIFILIRLHPESMDIAAMTISLGLLISPYSWAYEQVLLIIPVVWIIGKLSTKSPFLVSAMVFLLMSVFSLGLLVLASSLGNDVWSFLIPLVCYIAITGLIFETSMQV